MRDKLLLSRHIVKMWALIFLRLFIQRFLFRRQEKHFNSLSKEKRKTTSEATQVSERLSEARCNGPKDNAII